MNPLLQALFSSWEWRLEIIVLLLALALVYTTGWWRLRRKAHGKLATVPRLAAYGTALLIMAIALMSPIDVLGGQLFFMHMVQHLLTIMLAAPLLWLASPFPISLWGLPRPVRRAVGSQFRPGAGTRRALAMITRPAFAWLLFLFVYLGWHDPNLYNLALRRAWVHDLEHITFFLAAVIFWWHVVGAAPHIHGRLPDWGRIGYVLAALPPNMLAGVAIAFSSSVIYTYYESIPNIWGVTTLQDQMLGGVIMWIVGSMMYILAALILISGLLKRQGGPQPIAGWDADSAMVAPGLEHRVVQNKWRDVENGSEQIPDVS
jgi:cytochrome c oxidase assembly factor CtaG